MITETFKFDSPAGLHARPAGELVSLAKSFAGSAVFISCGGRRVNAASMLSLLSLGLKGGSEVTVESENPEAMAAVVTFLKGIRE